MQADKFAVLKNINLEEWFSFVHHKFHLNNDLWDSQSLADCLRTAVRSFECVDCNQEAILINKINYKCFCKEHSVNIDKLEDQFITSEYLLQSSLSKLWKIEKILALVHERECYFNTNNIKERLSKQDEDKLKFKKEKLIEIIKEFKYGIEESSKLK